MSNNKKLCVMMHGYGADKNDLASLIPLMSSWVKDVEFISIDAPVVCEQGVGRQWYSLSGYFSRVDKVALPDFVKSDIDESLKYLDGVLQSELDKRSLKYSDLILLGFSQGGTMALLKTLFAEKGKEPFKCVAFSAAGIFDEIYSNNKTEILLCHGTDDEVVVKNVFENTKVILDKNNVIYKSVLSKNTGHWISEEGMEKAVEFLNK